MPIDGLIKGNVFDPNQIAVISAVFEDVLRTLGVVDRENPLAETVARKIIQLAQTGEYDPTILRTRVLAAVDTSRKGVA
jgi:hypothetical protein